MSVAKQLSSDITRFFAPVLIFRPVIKKKKKKKSPVDMTPSTNDKLYNEYQIEKKGNASLFNLLTKRHPTLVSL